MVVHLKQLKFLASTRLVEDASEFTIPDSPVEELPLVSTSCKPTSSNLCELCIEPLPLVSQTLFDDSIRLRHVLVDVVTFVLVDTSQVLGSLQSLGHMDRILELDYDKTRLVVVIRLWFNMLPCISPSAVTRASKLFLSSAYFSSSVPPIASGNPLTIMFALILFVLLISQWTLAKICTSASVDFSLKMSSWMMWSK